MTLSFFPIVELVDRYAIAEIKYERTQANQPEVDWYRKQFSSVDVDIIRDDLDSLKDIHNQIWNLEADLKSGNEDIHSLEEIGRRAIAIRNLNNKRIVLKNTMAAKLNCSVREIKKDHLSE